MQFRIHNIENQIIAELNSQGIVIHKINDALDLLANAMEQNSQKIIAFSGNFTPDFFQLKTGLLGEILQKFATYQFQLAIVGDFTPYMSKNFSDFIYESNKTGRIYFVSTLDEAIEKLTK